MPHSVSSDGSTRDRDRDTDEADDAFFTLNTLEIDKLQDHGIGASDIGKLKAHGFYTVMEVHSTTKKRLAEVRGLSEAKVDKLKDAVSKCMPANRFITAAEYFHQRKKVYSISTGSKQLDSILGGGIKTSSITEVFGEYRCGKTQLASTLCVTAQLPKEMGGAAGKVAYIDTEGAFRPERVKEIASRFGLDGPTVMENCLFVRCFNSEMQHELLYDVSELFMSGEYRLLIIDSVIACFRVDYSGRGELQERQSKLGGMLSKLNLIASQYNVAVFVTNQVMSDPGGAMFAGVDGRKAAGGHVLSHASQTRILLRKGRGEERVAKVVDSPDVPEKDTTYIITSGGINDPDKA